MTGERAGERADPGGGAQERERNRVTARAGADRGYRLPFMT
ncbi:MAG: hypothetical protein ACK5LO_16610 [Leucobacter sp.]